MPKYKVGEKVQGKVTGIEDYGFFFFLYDGYWVLVHIFVILEKFLKNIFDYVQLGELISALIIEVDEVNKKLKLSIKNFDYRIEDKKELENQNGFSPLREKLPEWISEYEERMTSEN